jgi:hypothetical protein
MPIETGIFFEPVPLILKLIRSALDTVSSVSEVTKVEAKTTLGTTKKATRKREVFFIKKDYEWV